MIKYHSGDEIVVKIDRHGLGLNEGIGHLSDETMVVIQGAGEWVGRDVQAVITAQVQTSLGSSLIANVKA
jgi:uncharacterized protein YacL